jgi:hypothetical protein
MHSDTGFALKKAQVENYLRDALRKNFPKSGKRVSLRQRRRFIERITQEVGVRFGKDVLCLIDFDKGEWVTVVSPAHSYPTDKGRIHQSFAHPQVFYTSHCLERFSQRTGNDTNRIYVLDAFLSDALLSYGMDKKHLIGPAGIFAYEMDDDKLIVKTFVSYELLSDEQIRQFYRPEVTSLFAEGMVSDDPMDSDFILSDEAPPVA